MITPMLKQRTKDKVVFSYIKDLKAEALKATFGPELAQWLVAEIEENRQDDTKKYWDGGCVTDRESRPGCVLSTAFAFGAISLRVL